MGLAKRRSISIGDPALASYFGISTTYTGETVDECRALNISAVYRAVSLISGSIATLPLRAIETDDEGRKYRKPSWLDNPYGPVDDETIYQGTQEFWKRTVSAHFALYNEVFLFKVRNNAGAIVGALPIHPLAVRVEVDDNAPGKRLYYVTQDDGKELPLGTDDILHVIGLSTDGVRGISVLEKARNSFGIALAGERSAGTVMKNGPQHNVLVSAPNEDLTETEAKSIVDGVRANIAGADNAGKIVAINRALTLSPFTMSYQDAQFLETRVFQIEEIARWFGIPPHLLGQTEKQTSWGTGVAEQNAGLQRYVLNSITTCIQEGVSRLLAKKVKAEFDYAGFLAPTPKDEIELILAEMNGGLITPNEARALRNLPPVEGGDTLRTPAGQQPTEGDAMNGNPQNSQATQ